MYRRNLSILAWLATSLFLGCTPEFSSGGSADAGPSPDDTSSVPRSGLQLWLRGDLGVTVTNGHVSRWADQSGHGFDGTQVTVESRPVSVVNGIGARAAVRFDGDSNFLNLPPGMADFSHGLSIVAVVNEQQPNSYNSIMEFSNGTEIDDISFGQYQDRVAYEVADNTFAGSDISYDTPQLHTLVHRADSTLISRSNGELSGADQFALPDSITREQNSIGQSLYSGSVTYSGLIGEILVYSRGLTDNEVQAVETELKQRWSL